MEFSENMRAKDASRYLGVAKSTIWNYVKQGRIKAYRISEQVTIFKKSELDMLINGGANNGL
jgi:excisionase family DNA binding protein